MASRRIRTHAGDVGPKRRTGRAVAALLMVIAGLAGCAGGDGTGDRGTAPPEHGTGTDPAATTMTPVAQDPADLAAEAYVAGYPLVVSTRTMQRLGGVLGTNRLIWQRSLAGPQSRFIVAPNRDTLYSVAVLDLRAGPMVLTLPAVTDRYFTYQFLDAWTESFAYLGTRATAGRAGTWVVTAPGWSGELPAGSERIESPTPQVFLLGRFLVDHDADDDADDDADVAAAVTALSATVRLEPLSAITGTAAAPLPPLGTAAGTVQDIPTDERFFDELGDALAVNPPSTPSQQRIFAAFAPLGIGAGRHPTEEADAATRTALGAGAAEGNRRVDTEAAGRSPAPSGWSVNLDVGRYGDDLMTRAVVARVGWGANIPEEAVYAVARTAVDGRALDGSLTYRITFPAGELPPVDAFWSLTVYGPDMFFVGHPSARYSISDHDSDLTLRPDGSLELVLSTTEPASAPGSAAGSADHGNWLPTPVGPFVLMLRLYLPGPSVLDGRFGLPPIVPG